jgi:hypothetical protein
VWGGREKYGPNLFYLFGLALFAIATTPSYGHPSFFPRCRSESGKAERPKEGTTLLHHFSPKAIIFGFLAESDTLLSCILSPLRSALGSAACVVKSEQESGPLVRLRLSRMFKLFLLNE